MTDKRSSDAPVAGSAEHLRFWAAIHEYVHLCGGRTDKISVEVQRAVTKIEGAARAWPNAPRVDKAPGESEGQTRTTQFEGVVDAYRNGISWGLHHARYHEDMRSLDPIPFCERVVVIAEQQAQRVRRPESSPAQECLKGARVTPHALQAGVTSFGEEYATLGVEVVVPKGMTYAELRAALQELLDRTQ